MIYAIVTIMFLWAISTIYFLRHIKSINNELEELGKEQTMQNKDIMHLLKMDFEIAKVVDNHGKSILQTQTILEYIIEKSESKNIKTKSTNIFEPPKEEA